MRSRTRIHRRDGEGQPQAYWSNARCVPGVRRYLEPVAADIKTLRPDLLVWASPYSVGNLTRCARFYI